LVKLYQLPPIPHAAWKKLVHEVQVTCADLGCRSVSKTTADTKRMCACTSAGPQRTPDHQEKLKHAKPGLKRHGCDAICLLILQSPAMSCFSCLTVLVCCCLQVTKRLAALYAKAMQQADATSRLPLMACCALEMWLNSVKHLAQGSNVSSVAASVQRQLHDSNLMQHLEAGMKVAVAQLTAAVSAVAAAAASTRTSGSTLVPNQARQVRTQQLAMSVTVEDSVIGYCSCLLNCFFRSGCMLGPAAGELVNIQRILPAAPAAARLILSLFQTHSQLQQLQPGGGNISELVKALRMTPEVVGILSTAVVYAAPGTLQSDSTANELLQSPEFLSCLAVMVVVTVLGLDTSCADGASTQTGPMPAHGSNKGMQSRTGLQDNSAQQAEETASSNCSGVINGMRLDSLTALSRSWFDIQGISVETILQTALLVKSDKSTSLTTARILVTCYRSVLEHQVGRYDVPMMQWLCSVLQLLEEGRHTAHIQVPPKTMTPEVELRAVIKARRLCSSLSAQPNPAAD
jgi:hypothetical protein